MSPTPSPKYKSVLRGSFNAALMLILSGVAMILFRSLLTRVASLEVVGLFGIFIGLFSLLQIGFTGGITSGVPRYLAELKIRNAKRAISRLFQFVILSTILLSILLTGIFFSIGVSSSTLEIGTQQLYLGLGLLTFPLGISSILASYLLGNEHYGIFRGLEGIYAFFQLILLFVIVTFEIIEFSSIIQIYLISFILGLIIIGSITLYFRIRASTTTMTPTGSSDHELSVEITKSDYAGIKNGNSSYLSKIKLSSDGNIPWSDSSKGLILFGVSTMLSSGLLALFGVVDRVILLTTSGVGAVAIYFMAVFVSDLPVKLVSGIITPLGVRIGQYITSGQIGRISQLIKEYSQKTMMFILIPFTIIVFCTGDSLLGFLWGLEYVSGWYPLCILSIGSIFHGQFWILQRLYIGLRRPQSIVIGLSIGMGLFILSCFLLIPTLGMLGGAIAYLSAMITSCIILYFGLAKLLPINKRSFIRTTGLLGVIIISVILGSRILFSTSLIFDNLVIRMAFPIIIYITSLFLLKLITYDEIRTIITFSDQL